MEDDPSTRRRCTPVLFENGGADMLLMTGNTRSAGGSQGRAFVARRVSGLEP